MTSTPLAAKPVRSPSYPSLSLSDAIAQVRKIEGLYRLGPVDRIAGAKLIGYSGLSGPANQALASLAQYGLVERAGKGEMRVTERGRAILHPDSDEEKRQGLRTAALEPQLFRELHERWPSMIPPEDGVITYLNRQGFNKSAIRPAAKAYLQTLLFLQESGANESHGTSSPKGADSPLPKQSEEGSTVYGGAKVGDLIQWEVGGALQMEKPMRVRAVSEDGQWVLVDGSESAVPMSEVIIEERPAAAAVPPVFKFADTSAPASSALAGESEWMRSLVGRDTKVRLLVSGGDMGAKEIGKLMKLLEAQRAVLADDDDDDG
jgi:hypothetical protein